MMHSLTALFRRPPIGLWDIADILVVSILIYEVLKLIKGTRAVQMAVGAAFLAVSNKGAPAPLAPPKPPHHLNQAPRRPSTRKGHQRRRKHIQPE